MTAPSGDPDDEEPTVPCITTPPTLTGRIVELSPLRKDDAGELAEAVTDGELHREWWTSTPAPGDMADDLADKLDRAAAGTMVPFIIRSAGDGTALGVTCYYDLDPTVPRLEIGYTWLRASAQGKGANPEAKLLLMGYAFGELNCVRVGIRTKFTNTVSRAAIERLGLRRDGVLRSHARLRNGVLDDAVLYSALAHEWPVIRARLSDRVARHTSTD
ncbi:GNAT family protein [Corynebacterium sp. P7003]|uniref:GNAT family protein n=1 Tax=Corynebacterium pygosceleis TaxID=2800406 RepID=A0ABT3WQD9_9CORY|nr:GNAT family protein [Corynebacterium pygosceleis]MCX7444467.1 GNAT family protein [Corynebacterium pygosceleis]